MLCWVEQMPVGANTRQIELYKIILQKISSLKDLLEKKCQEM